MKFKACIVLFKPKNFTAVLTDIMSTLGLVQDAIDWVRVALFLIILVIIELKSAESDCTSAVKLQSRQYKTAAMMFV